MRAVEQGVVRYTTMSAPTNKQGMVILLLLVSFILFLFSTFILYGIQPPAENSYPVHMNQISMDEQSM